MDIDDVAVEDKHDAAAKESEKIEEICPVFNCTVSAQAAVSWRELLAVGLEVRNSKKKNQYINNRTDICLFVQLKAIC